MSDRYDASERLAIPFSYAFQPIVNVELVETHSYEALIRGPKGDSAGSVLGAVAPEDLHRFDRESRIAAVRIAGGLGIAVHLNLNALPQSLDASDAHLRALVEAAEASEVRMDRLVLEITETEAVQTPKQFAAAMDGFRSVGMKLAIDDFGAGYSGLNMLVDFQPDVIKLDMKLVRGIESSGPRQSIARGIAMVCGDLGIDIVAEGVETIEEYGWLRDEGVHLFQGYLFAKPGFEGLPVAQFPHAL